MVVVGVVARNLASAGDGEERNVTVYAVVRLEILDCADVARLLSFGICGAVQLDKNRVKRAAFNLADQFCRFHGKLLYLRRLILFLFYRLPRAAAILISAANFRAV